MSTPAHPKLPWLQKTIRLMHDTNRAILKLSFWTVALFTALPGCGSGSADEDETDESSTSGTGSGSGTTEGDSGSGDTDIDDSDDDSSDSSGDEGDTGSDTDDGPGEYTGVLEGWCSSQPDEFSFFVTSMNALWTLAGDPVSDLNGGFGGNYGGVEGADAICQEIAWAAGHGHKTWRAFLSATDDGNGSPVNAIERIGEGPWYDANGRLVASGLSGLSGDRPDGDAQSVDDLPDECGVPSECTGRFPRCAHRFE